MKLETIQKIEDEINNRINLPKRTKEIIFLGFLPLNKKLRKEKLEEIEKAEKTVILYEAPHKLEDTLADLKNIIENRKLTIA